MSKKKKNFPKPPDEKNTERLATSDSVVARVFVDEDDDDEDVEDMELVAAAAASSNDAADGVAAETEIAVASVTVSEGDSEIETDESAKIDSLIENEKLIDVDKVVEVDKVIEVEKPSSGVETIEVGEPVVDESFSSSSTQEPSCMEAAMTPRLDVVEGPVEESVDFFEELANSQDEQEFNEEDSLISESTEVATTSDATEVVAKSETTELTANPVQAELSVNQVKSELTTETSTVVQPSAGGVSDLVTEQLRQMFEEGGATATCATAGSFTGTHTMNLNVKAGAVDMNLQTVTEANQELLELKTQIELQKRLLDEAQTRLDNANKRIGHLELELEQKNKVLDEKLEQGSWLRSLFGMK